MSWFRFRINSFRIYSLRNFDGKLPLYSFHAFFFYHFFPFLEVYSFRINSLKNFDGSLQIFSFHVFFLYHFFLFLVVYIELIYKNLVILFSRLHFWSLSMMSWFRFIINIKRLRIYSLRNFDGTLAQFSNFYAFLFYNFFFFLVV